MSMAHTLVACLRARVIGQQKSQTIEQWPGLGEILRMGVEVQLEAKVR